MLKRSPRKRDLRGSPDSDLLRLWQTEQIASARELLVERYQGLVRSIAGQFRVRQHDFDDYVQVGNLGLLSAIDNCDEGRELSSYARPAIYHEIRDYKRQTEGPVYRPADSDDSFKYRWASDGAKAMLLASDANCFSDPLSMNYRPRRDWSFEYQYESEDDTFEFHDLFADEAESFDRRGHEDRVKLDLLLETLDPRARHIIEKRWLINECFDHIRDYIESPVEERRPVEQEDLAVFFGIGRQRIGQIEAAAITKMKASPVTPGFPAYDPHFVTQRWNALTTYPRIGTEWCGIDALERLWEPISLQRWSKPAIGERGRRWFKPRIHSDEPRPKELSWPYPRPALTWKEHRALAGYLFFAPTIRRDPRAWRGTTVDRCRLLAVAKTRGPDATTGDVVRALKAIRRFWSQKPPGKRAKNWRYVDPSGQLIPGADGCPGDSCWPQAWRFPGWYPRPKRKAKSDFVFMRKGREWIPLDDPNAPEVRGDDGSLMSDAVGNTAEFAKGKGERPIRLAIGACSRFRPSV